LAAGGVEWGGTEGAGAMELLGGGNARPGLGVAVGLGEVASSGGKVKKSQKGKTRNNGK